MAWTKSAREDYGCRWMCSTLSVAKKASATAFPRQVAGLPIEQVMQTCRSSAWKAQAGVGAVTAVMAKSLAQSRSLAAQGCATRFPSARHPGW